MKRNSRPRGFTLIELLIAMAIILLLAGIAIPHLGKQMTMAHENAALQTIHTLHTEEAQYYARYGRYATSLVQLGPPANGAEGSQAAGLIPRALAGGRQSGYLWALNGSPVGYTISAVPETFGKDGSRTFYSDESMVVHYNESAEPATAHSAALGEQAPEAK